MRRVIRRGALAALMLTVTGVALAQPPARYGIGRTATPAEIAALDIDVRPDGTGLPAGSGTSAAGATIYASKCAQCHGATGKEGPNDVLVGRVPGDGFPFAADPKVPHTIGNYWPYATTVFDYIRRAMPPQSPWTLSADETYALTAYLLHLGGVLPADAVLDQRSLPALRMPNREGFVPSPEARAAGLR